MSHHLAIVEAMELKEIAQLLADADAGRQAGPARSGGYAVVAYEAGAGPAEGDEDYDEDLKSLVVWDTRSSAAEAFDLIGDRLARGLADATVDEFALEAAENATDDYDGDDFDEDEFEADAFDPDGFEANDFDRWFKGDESALALLKAKPTNSRKMLMFLLYGYYAPMSAFDAKTQSFDPYMGGAVKLFTGARALYGASAASPHQEEAMAVFELQPTDREDGPNSLDERGMSPLHHAVARGDLTEVTALLEAGADPNLQAEYGNSPLFAATDRRGETASALKELDSERWVLTRVLLDHGADIDSRDRVGRTLADLAAGTLPYPAEVIADLTLQRESRR